MLNSQKKDQEVQASTSSCDQCESGNLYNVYFV